MIVCLAVFGWDRFTICPFRAVVSDQGPDHVLSEFPVSKEEKAAFAAVLSQYGERYRETSDGIWITPRLYFDKELRWNYTSKK